MARDMYKRRRYCRFSAEGIKEVDYKDVDLLKDFISISLLLAELLLGCCSVNSNWNGDRPFVYFAPTPFSWSSILFETLFVMPVYKVSSEHFRI